MATHNHRERKISLQKTPSASFEQSFLVVDNMRRDPCVKGCGTSKVDRVLSEKAGKCADIHSVYTALVRALGVLALEIYGLRMYER